MGLKAKADRERDEIDYSRSGTKHEAGKETTRSRTLILSSASSQFPNLNSWISSLTKINPGGRKVRRVGIPIRLHKEWGFSSEYWPLEPMCFLSLACLAPLLPNLSRAAFAPLLPNLSRAAFAPLLTHGVNSPQPWTMKKPPSKRRKAIGQANH